MTSSITLAPRYGRDYTRKADAIQDWKDGKDFTVTDFFSRWNGVAVSIREIDQLREDGNTEVHIRYARLTKIAVVKL